MKLFVDKIFRTYYIIKDWYKRKIFSKFQRLCGYCKFQFYFPSVTDEPIEDLNLYSAKIFSQNGEDGMIRGLFEKIKTTNNYAVEIGVEDGKECNTRYLIEKKGWDVLQIDGQDNLPITNIKQEYITAENINELLMKYNVPEKFDLLSIDIDYNTYWVWKAIQNYSPRVVIVEYNAAFPPNESKAVEYNPNGRWDGTNYFGASLFAFYSLGCDKQYTLIACDKRGVNAFFVRNDLAHNFVVKDIELIYKSPQYGQKINGRYIGKPVSKQKMIIV